jgi:hypothetical protein
MENNTQKNNKRRCFTQEEDKLLIQIKSENPFLSWKMIASYFKNREARQCMYRYNHYLDPSIQKEKWSKDEEDLILEKFKLFGTKWNKYLEFLPGRTANNVKNYWYSCLSHKKKSIKPIIDDNYPELWF